MYNTETLTVSQSKSNSSLYYIIYLITFSKVSYACIDYKRFAAKHICNYLFKHKWMQQFYLKHNSESDIICYFVTKIY